MKKPPANWKQAEGARQPEMKTRINNGRDSTMDKIE